MESENKDLYEDQIQKSPKGNHLTYNSYFKKFKLRFINHFENEFDIKKEYIERLKFLIDYNCTGGKHNRAHCLTEMTKKLCGIKEIDFNEKMEEKTFALACCIEILQASFLMADDISDNSKLRRGKPCWYRREDVKLAGINDAFILESFANFILWDVFQDDENYLLLNNTFRDVILKTQIGQMIDLSFLPEHKDIDKLSRQFCKENFDSIVKHKTAYYTYYLPIASALILCGMKGQKEIETAEQISLLLGRKFQVQDDFMDCYYGPEKIGKVGTDIEENKCSWLAVNAMSMADENQKRIMLENYGIDDVECCEKIKKLYRELKLEDVYMDEEKRSYGEILKFIEEHDNLIPKEALLPMLNQIHMRHC